MGGGATAAAAAVMDVAKAACSAVVNSSETCFESHEKMW